MLHRKKRTIVLIMIISFALVIYFQNKIKKYPLTTYEIELIDYFKEVALQSEYYDSSQKVIKWVEPMVLFVKKEEEFNPQMLVIKKTINKINQLATDGFKILLTNDFSKSNSVLFLCSKNELAKSAPYFYDVVTDVITEDVDHDIAGYAYSEFVTETHIIDKALIFISSEYILDTQESSIIEEITQSLGLAFDSKKYANSIFYQDKTEQKFRVKEYSELDKDIIRLLYHPKMKPGLDSTELEKVIIEILKSEKK